MNKPENIILVASGQGQGGKQHANILFGIWPNGLIRRVTASEHAMWDKPAPDRTLVAGTDDGEWDYLYSYDLALRVPKTQWKD
jgi:hypothetical protein